MCNQGHQLIREVRIGRGEAAYLAVLVATGKYLVWTPRTLRVLTCASGLTLNHLLNLGCLADL